MRELTFFFQILLCDILLILQDVIVITLLQGPTTPLLGMFYRSRLGLTILGGSAIVGIAEPKNYTFQQNPSQYAHDVVLTSKQRP